MHPFCSSFGLSHAHQLNKSRFDLTDLPIYLSAPVHPSRVGEPKICTRIASHALSRGVGSLIQNARQASNIGRDDFTQSQIEAPVPTTKAHQSSSCQCRNHRRDVTSLVNLTIDYQTTQDYTSIYKYRILLSSIKCVKYWCHLICLKSNARELHAPGPQPSDMIYCLLSLSTSTLHMASHKDLLKHRVAYKNKRCSSSNHEI